MTQLLEKAFAAAARLPDEEQDVVAALVLEELDAERLWDEKFARSQAQLAGLAAAALADHASGKTRPLKLDE